MENGVRGSQSTTNYFFVVIAQFVNCPATINSNETGRLVLVKSVSFMAGKYFGSPEFL